MTLLATFAADVFDLVLGRRCLECDEPGRSWCATCLAAFPRDLSAQPAPGTDVPLVCATAYAGTAREAVIDFKEHGNRSLAPMLGRLLADAVATHHDRFGPTGAVIVRVPGHRRPARGFDALATVMQHARPFLARQRLAVAPLPVLRLRRDRGPVKRLDRLGRQAAVAGTMHVAGPAAHLLATMPGRSVLVVDDVVTTGATVAEAIDTLARAGIETAGVAAIARA